MSTKLFEIDEDEIIAVRGKFKGTFKYFCRGNVFYKRPATKTKKERYVCFRANDGKYKCQVCIMKNEQDKFILDMTEGHDHNEPGDKKKIERIVIQIQKETLELQKNQK
ncbi:uncharacterized protein LOC122860834 [Aphidius gifuensis]|uniref:uncharacterized protein LOC122860834 n=1 Tax=Aphidius gifuensis TaxID=684658 RepID=UPI001CDD3D01|nr:uncharacterized protein LOC122860834 [Aphidius gifuensis]